MTCDRIRPLLSAYHDDALAPGDRARVATHLATCVTCRAILGAYEDAYGALRAAPAPVPPDLRRNVYACVAELEARRRHGAGRVLGPALLGTLRTAGSTAGLLAVLGALVFAVTHLDRLGRGGTSPVPDRGLPVAVAAAQIPAAGTVVSAAVGAVGRGAAARLPAAEQTAIAPARALFKQGRLSLGRGHAVGNTVFVPGTLRLETKGVPRAVLPVNFVVARRSDTPTVGRVALGAPVTIPTVAPGDGLVYLHVYSDSVFLPWPHGGNSPAEVEWRPFAPGAQARTLVRPAPYADQLLTAVTASLDGTSIAYAAMGRGPYGGIFSVALADRREQRLLPVPDYYRPNTGLRHFYVKQVAATARGLLYTLMDQTPVSSAVTVNLLTGRGALPLGTVPQFSSSYLFSPDLRTIAWIDHPAGVQGFGTLRVASLQPGEPAPRTLGTGAHPVWSPDGTQLLYKSPTGLIVWSARDGHAQRLVGLNAPGQPFISTFTWAPNSRLFAYVLTNPVVGGSSEVRLGDATTGQTWTAFTRRWIGAIAWAHDPHLGPTIVPPTSATTVTSTWPLTAPSTAPAALGAAGATTGRRQKAADSGLVAAPERTTTGTTTGTTAGDSPAGVLERYYQNVNRHAYADAFSLVRFVPGDHPDFALFKGGYTPTRFATLTRLVPAPYRNASSIHTTTCVGFELLSRQSNGRTTRYGGWYMLESTGGHNLSVTAWRIVMSRSHSVLNGHATIPPRAACSVK